MASVNYVAMELLGAKQISIYDGSWSEYAASGNRIEKETNT
jgi:3-mercaptopyruvate sulfurtransferase SseA